MRRPARTGRQQASDERGGATGGVSGLLGGGASRPGRKTAWMNDPVLADDERPAVVGALGEQPAAMYDLRLRHGSGQRSVYVVKTHP